MYLKSMEQRLDNNVTVFSSITAQTIVIMKREHLKLTIS